MKRLITILSLFSIFILANCAETEYDILIRNATIIDGSGAAGYSGDVGILAGKIVYAGPSANGVAKRIIDAQGKVVSPGFIDMMGGSSVPLLRDPVSAESKLRQGISTMMVGEGGSVAPRKPEWNQGSEGPTWTTFGEYFELLEAKGIALNVVHNVGAAQVRRVVLGDEDVDPTPEQLEEMKQLVDQAMQDGTVGLSTSLIYPPGHYAETEEISELAKVAAKYGGVYFSHMRNESNMVVKAIEELLAVSRNANIPAHIYHLKAAGKENWHLMQQAIDLIEKSRNEGLEITADIYPYIRNGIGLGSFLHPRHYARGSDAFLSTLDDRELRKRLRKEVETTSDWENWYRHVGMDWDNVLITSVREDQNQSFVGLSVKEVGEKRSIDVWDAFFDLVKNGRTSVVPLSMNEEQKHLALRTPFICFDVDASPVNPVNVKSGHPRAFGTFPRILAKYVREDKIIPIEEAIRKMTSLPASILRLKDRGMIRENYMADLVIFDPEKIQDKATFTEPLQYSEGIEYMIVNGKLVIDDNEVTDNLPGMVLRHKKQ